MHKVQVQTHDVLSLVGRILISGIFISAGISKLKQAKQTEAYIKSKNIPFAPAARYAAASTEILGGSTLLLGLGSRIGASTLIGFLIPTTLIFHKFWGLNNEQEKQMQQINFLKNLAVMGGLLKFVAHGHGVLGVDRLIPESIVNKANITTLKDRSRRLLRAA